MNVQILNDKASLKIVSDGDVRYISKNKIEEITIIDSNIIKIDIGEGALNNIFIAFGDVTAPTFATVEELRDALNEMLETTACTIDGFASSTNQERELEILQLIAELVSQNVNITQNLSRETQEIANQVAKVNNYMEVQSANQAFAQPLLEDNSNANAIYKGYSESGASTSDAVWAILKVTNVRGIVSYAWANGNKDFSNIWNNRKTLVYS